MKPRISVFRNTVTGAYYFRDDNQARLKRMRGRIFSWARVVSELMGQKGVRMVMYRLSYRADENYHPGDVTE
jgi:hypothetical protein